jgi:hypothetical protein
VYIGRPSIWGNPFIIGKDGSREEVIEKYIKYLNDSPDLIKRAKEELNEKILGCWCAPNLCHGHILAQLANEEN